MSGRNVGIVPPVAILAETGQLETDQFCMRYLHVVAKDELLIGMGPGLEGRQVDCDDGIESAHLHREADPMAIDLLTRHVGVDGLLGQTCLVLRHGDGDGDRGVGGRCDTVKVRSENEEDG
jgi:hypothetical protein